VNEEALAQWGGGAAAPKETKKVLQNEILSTNNFYSVHTFASRNMIIAGTL
jgi:hypothetical protein